MEIFHLVTMGTSLTAGNASSGGQWQPVLTRALAPGKADRVRVSNVGAGGVTSDYGLATSLPLTLKYRPDAVTIEYLMNDCSTSNSVSEALCESNTIAIMDALRAELPSIAIFLLILNPALASVTSRAGLNTYNAIYRALAVSEGVGLIDTWDAWGTPTTTEIPDSIHPTLAANVEFALPEMVTQIAPVIG